MHKLYWQRAQAYRAAQQYPQAERTLLAIRRWDAAAEMYKAASMYSDYLRLMKQSPDNLGAAQLWVAQELEAEGHHRCCTHPRSTPPMHEQAKIWCIVLRLCRQRARKHKSVHTKVEL